jgi:hypothetical protein
MTSIENFPKVDMTKFEGEVIGDHALTGEDVMRDYESAVKEIEAMGAELIGAAKKCEAMAADVREMIRDTAEAYRQEGKRIFNRIEECALFTGNVRKTCEDVQRRMTEGTSEVQ